MPTVNRAVDKPAEKARPARHSVAAETPTEAESRRPQPETRKALSGSALSPDTWRQTIDALRDLTVRSK